MPRKHATNAAGHEIPPVASNRPAPTAATSSNTNVARKKPAAFANGIHSATADGDSGRASVIRLCGGFGRFRLVLERGRRDAKTRWHLQSHDSAHDADKRVVMHGMCDGIHNFAPDGGRRNLRADRR